MATSSKYVRRWAVIDRQVFKEIEGYAKEAGVKTSTFINLSVVLGARMYARSLSPEKFITPEMYSQIVRAATEQGVHIGPMSVEKFKPKKGD